MMAPCSRVAAVKEALQKAADKISSFAGSLFGSKSETTNDGDDVGFERVRVYKAGRHVSRCQRQRRVIYGPRDGRQEASRQGRLRLLGIAGVPLFKDAAEREN